MEFFLFTKDFFPLKFSGSEWKLFANFLGMFLETASYVARGPFDWFFSDFVIIFFNFFWNLSPKFSVLIFFPAGSSKMHSESPEESFEGIHKFWGNMLSLSFFADFQWIF